MGPAPAAGGTLHYIANIGEDANAVAALGYNLFDIGPGERIDALPPGGRALVWLGDLGDEDCAPPRVPFAEFKAAVDRLAGHPRVYGYFIADEPHPRACPTAVDEIRRRADYIRARAPWQRSFIVVQDGTNQCGGTYGCEFSALRPAESHVDLIGLDPYPCSVDKGCLLSKVDDTVRRAAAAGIPRRAMVPVFQAFGQSCSSGSNYYRLPNAAEARALLARWAAAVPQPAFDYTYTWGRQGSSCPSLADADGEGGYPDLQSVFAAHNS
ncbi:MAG TPA: hypothetical protein VHN18_08490 [Micromonosporaceae bacterium]|nr:hypothetical protein [Micromonosporaceae bacterium]